MRNRIEMICVGACGLAGAIVVIGLLARLSRSLVRICGVALIASLAFMVYKLVKERNL